MRQQVCTLNNFYLCDAIQYTVDILSAYTTCIHAPCLHVLGQNQKSLSASMKKVMFNGYLCIQDKTHCLEHILANERPSDNDV